MTTKTIGIPADYFLRMAKHDYNNFAEALPREFFQNSLDAGATKIEVASDEPTRTITISDDGCGMSRGTLIDKLLVLGGSKKAKGATGAFGKAKELLFFSWASYSIRTRNLLVEGCGATYTISTTDNEIQGTVCTICVPEAENFDSLRWSFKWVARRFQVPSKIIVDGDQIECETKRGKKVKELDFGAVHLLKKTNNAYMRIRINGQWMFDAYIGDGRGTIVVELNKQSTEVLTSNRDGFKWEYRNQLEQFINALAIEGKKAMKQRPAMVREILRGNGKIELAGTPTRLTPKENMIDIIGAMRDEQKVPDEQVVVSDVVNAVIQGLHGANHENAPQMIVDALEPIVDQRVTVEMKAAKTHTMVKALFEDAERLGLIGYNPDFVLQYPENKRSKVHTFMGTTKAQLLATMWTETLKQILLDNGIYISFVAGFSMDPDVEAEIETIDGDVYFYVNPWNLLRVINKSKKLFTKRTPLGEDLKDRAIHEITHLECPEHNLDFIDCMALVRAKTWESAPLYRRIRRIGK